MSIFLGIIIGLMILQASCTHTRLLNLSKNEISKLDTVYYEVFNHKFFDTEWIFYEKQICQLKTKMVSTKVYTGTWIELNDTIYANFFYGKKVAKVRKLLINKTNGELRELY